MMVQPVGDEFKIDFVTAIKTYEDAADGSAAFAALREAKKTEYGVDPGNYFEANGGRCLYTVSYNKKLKELTFRVKWNP